MNRSWITALTLATVVGTGGAFVGVITASNEQPVAAAPEPTLAPAALVGVTTPHLDPTGTVAYRLDSVGIVTVSVASGGLSVLSSVADPGWTALSVHGSGTHADASFTDGSQLVTFEADLAGGNVMVSVGNVAVSPATTAPITDAAPAPAQPAQTVPAIRATTPGTTTPTQQDDREDDGWPDRHTESNDD